MLKGVVVEKWRCAWNGSDACGAGKEFEGGESALEEQVDGHGGELDLWEGLLEMSMC